MPKSSRDAEPTLALAIDAATPPSSVALVRGAETLAAETGPFGRGADAWIVPAVDRLLAAASIEVADLDLLAATTGPGAFTGIRVGLATAAGLAAGSGVATVGVSTLTALIESATTRAATSSPDTVLAVIDARRGQIYAAYGRPSVAAQGGIELEWGPVVTTADELVERFRDRELLLAGPGAHLVDGPLGLECVEAEEPVAAAAGRIALRTPTTERPGLLPTYLRAPDAVPGRSPLRRNRRRGPV